MNFLLGLGLLILIVFYFAGAYLIYLPLSAVAPNWAGPAAGIAVLAAAGVTVQLLSMAMSELRGIALYNKSERAGVLAYSSQAVIVLGHIGTIYAAKGLVFDGVPVAGTTLLIIAALYFTGVALALHEWRQRKFSRT
jgi:predicted exporter